MFPPTFAGEMETEHKQIVKDALYALIGWLWFPAYLR